MTQSDYETIYATSERLVRETTTETKRFLLESIDWNNRLIGILGSRGTGKTTLILQHIKESFADNPYAAMYVSLDNLWFEAHSLKDLVEFHYNNGGTHVFLDEVHYNKDWQQVVKNIYDEFRTLKIVYTGSSLLKIDKAGADLSRRQITYTLPGLSFREFLNFEGIVTDIKAVTLQELISKHEKLSEELCRKTKILRAFNTYLQSGYYPFYRESTGSYSIKLSQITNQILETDYPAVEKINYSTVRKIKKMLYILAQSCPQTPNMSELFAQLETDRNLGMKMLYLLDRANLLNLLSSEKSNLKNMSKPDKIYCDNTNLMFSLTSRPETGTIRETFFLNQLKSAGHKVTYPQRGDFLVDDSFLFEIGGKNKTFNQIKDIPNSFLAIDDTETGRKNRIPLWMFGLLY
ncbi:MAG: ATP-binding protein [Spirochaetales bacterium]|nr:ATP-binding protein [Spirochaetales bacterium]